MALIHLKASRINRLIIFFRKNASYRFIKIFSFKSVPIYLHRSTVLILCLALLFSYASDGGTLILGLPYFMILVIHEIGHLLMAHHFKYSVNSIQIYPFWGFCHYERPQYHYEDVVISWGGVLAQFLLFIPAVILLLIWKDPPPIASSILIMLGYFNFMILAFNLAPISGFDGGKAWGILPYLIRKVKK